jgi:pimeloyl-ACP methyl ester carboxylesterase
VVVVAVAGVVIVNWTWGRLPATPSPTGKFMSVDGVHVRYLETPGREPAVLFVHGQPGTAEDFEAIRPLLAGRRTIAIDRPGYGFSSGGYYPYDRQLAVIAGVLSRLGVHREVLMGHSYGGTLAIGYAETHPAGLAGIVLLDAAGACSHVDGFQRAQARLVQGLELPVIAQLADVTFSQVLRKTLAESGDTEAFSPDPVDQRHLHRLLAINLKHGNLEAFAGEALAANGVVSHINDGLRSIRTPTVVIQGSADKLVEPRCGEAIAREIPGARLELVSGGHMTPYTHAAQAAAAADELAAPAQAHTRAPARP